jgi:TonB family protein
MSIKNKISYRNIPVKGFILSLWNRLISEARYRMSGSISFSIIIHLLLLLGYFSLSALDQPVEPPIREISFIDLTEMGKNPEDIIKQKKSQPPPKRIIAQTKPQEKKEVAKSSSSAALALGKDRIFLDSPRKQAPINIKEFEPVADNIKKVINVSPAIGVKKDDRIAKPQAIDLGSNPKVLIASASTASGALDFDQSGNSQIDLEPGRISGGSVEAVSGDFGAVAPEPNEQESLLKPRETQTVITGVLANREILKKIVPPFPRWAKMQGVGATISLQFTVMENGVVKENVIIARTSGSLQWDRMVIAALKNWQFVALPQKGIREDQTGVITFKFEI